MMSRDAGNAPSSAYNRQGDCQQLRLFPDDDQVPAPDDPDVVRIRLRSVGWTNPRRFGDVWLALWLWKYLRLDEIVNRHVSQGKETIRPADIVAIEVINRLCGPCSEFALAEHWYASTALEDLLGVPDSAVTKDRLYRTLDHLLRAQMPIENDLKERLGTLFQLDYDLLLYDLTSTYFEGLAEENDLARRGYSRDHRSDCKQIVLALIVTREGFPLAHLTFAGNTQDVQTVETIVEMVEARFGRSQRIWVMDRGMISKDTLKLLNQPGRRYLLATRRGELQSFAEELRSGGWERLEGNPDVEVKMLKRKKVHYLLARSRPRRQKERAIRRRQRRGLAKALLKLHQQIEAGRLKKRDKILERVGTIKGRFPKARIFVTITVARGKQPQLSWKWNLVKFRTALRADGAYLLRSNQAWLDGRGVLGDLHSVDRGGAGLPGTQERANAAASLAPLQRSDPGARDGLRAGLCSLEDAGSSGQAGWPGDADPQARPAAAKVLAQISADDSRGHPPRAGPYRYR